MDEFLGQFLIEGRELVQQASDDLLALERDGITPARLDSAFRAVHTLKGSVGLFDLAPMGRALHAAEDVLEAARAGRVAAGGAFLDPLLACIGACEAWLDAIGLDGGLPATAPAQCGAIEAALRPFLPDRPGGGPGGVMPPPAPAAEDDWAGPLAARQAEAVAAARAAGMPVMAIRYTPAADCFFLGDDPLALMRSIPDLVALEIAPRAPWPEPAQYDPYACNLCLLALSTAPAEALRQIFRFVPDQLALAGLPAPVAAPGPEPAAEAGPRLLRVDAARVDTLLDIVGEMMVAKNALAGLVARATAADAGLGRALGASQAEMERLAGAMHRAVIGMRMVPLAQTFRRFPRLMRETLAGLGKSVGFEMRGEEVEADRAVVEGLFQPLLHLLRNAADHGVEETAARVAAGKPALGRVTLEARRQGDQILVSVTDDGAGLDPAALRATALRRGLGTPAAIAALDDAAALQLIFAPGFSTARQVTEISGRGVGMDAVRSAVEGLGGRVALASRPGAGTSMQLILPRATVITTVITVQLGPEQFGVPIDCVVETLRLPDSQIRPIGAGEAFVHRGRTLPLLRLAALLGRPVPPRTGLPVRLLVVACGAEQVGVAVDAVAGRMDLLLRPMTGLLAGMAGVLGTALLGDGQVLLVLDLPELVG